MKHLAIVIRDGAFDRMLTPLTFVYTQAAEILGIDRVSLWRKLKRYESG